MNHIILIQLRNITLAWFTAGFMIISTFSCDSDDFSSCQECVPNQFVESVESLEVQFRYYNSQNIWYATPVIDQSWIQYRLCTALIDIEFNANDIFTINGSIHTPCDSSSSQFLKIENFEITGLSFQECAIPENIVTTVIDLDCEIEEDIRIQYGKTAANMACEYLVDPLNFLFDDTTPDLFLKALSAIHQSDLPEAKLVMDEYQITGRATCQKNICLFLADTLTWTFNILNGEKISGNNKFDSLVNVANLDISYYGQEVYLNPTTKLVNADSLATYFEPIEGVITSESCYTIVGDGSRVSYLAYDNSIQINFSIGYGDCPSGCISRTYWNFMVHDDCKVDFLENCGNLRPSFEEREWF